MVVEGLGGWGETWPGLGGMTMWTRIGRGCYFSCGRRQEDRRADVFFEKIFSFWENLKHVYRVYQSPSSLDIIIKGQSGCKARVQGMLAWKEWYIIESTLG
jgi:hypothetical protein